MVTSIEEKPSERLEICVRCRYYSYNTAECRRRAPIITGGMMSNKETVFPETYNYNWCGEWELAPNK